MIPKEILKKVRQIQIRTSHLVTDMFLGGYESVFKGRGIEFEEVREYQPGDDVRTIDWNVTARKGHPFIKLFKEERELTVMLLVDLSHSGRFGSVKQFKNEIAAEISALLAFSAIKNNDKVGLIIFTDKVEKFVPPKKGKRHVLRVIRELLYFQPKSKHTNISVGLEYLTKVTSRRTVTFLVSDFISPPEADYELPLRIANKRNDVIAITITDPRELELPNVGFIELQDAETGEFVLVDSSNSNVRKQFAKANARIIKDRNDLFRSTGIDTIDIRTNRSYVEPIMRFFRIREKRL
ncbi:MAG: DUF58 domain-containing protein [Candidatus Brocadiales bacterium]